MKETKKQVVSTKVYEAPSLKVTEIKVEAGFAVSKPDKLMGGSINSFNPIPW